mgnify:CR=1 FL=1
MEKGVSGHLMAAILVIITGIIAAVIFYIFISGAGGRIEQSWAKLQDQFKQAICDMIPGTIRWVVGC